jgi:hypothetical protein
LEDRFAHILVGFGESRQRIDPESSLSILGINPLKFGIDFGLNAPCFGPIRGGLAKGAREF